MTWYMRGGITYEEAILLSASERDIIHNIIKENLDIAQKTRMPFF